MIDLSAHPEDELPSTPLFAGVLETIRERGHLICGVGDGPKGYSTTNSDGFLPYVGSEVKNVFYSTEG